MKLPESFKNKMIKLLGEEGFAEYEKSLQNPMYNCLRVNTLKISVEGFLKISPFELTPVPWTKNAFYYDASKFTPSKHPFYFAGLYYIQEPSAMYASRSLRPSIMSAVTPSLSGIKSSVIRAPYSIILQHAPKSDSNLKSLQLRVLPLY